MTGSVTISVAIMFFFAGTLSEYIYQTWLKRKHGDDPIKLHRRRKVRMDEVR